MNATSILILAGFAALGLLILVAWRAWPSRNGIERALGAMSVAILALSATAVLIKVLFLSQEAWSVERLAASLALRKGYNIFQQHAGDGPQFSWLYGPVGAIAYWPATFINSLSALRVAAAMAAAFFFGPAAWLLLRDPGVASVDRTESWAVSRTASWATFALFCAFSVGSPALEMAISIHVDAPALALAAIAVILLYIPANRSPFKRESLSALAIVLAVWTKQSFLPLLVALPALLLLTDSRRVAVRYLANLAGFFLATTLFFCAWLGRANLLNRMFLMLATCPWTKQIDLWGPPHAVTGPDRAKILFAAGDELISQLAPFLAILCFQWLMSRRRGGAGFHSESPRDWLNRNKWIIFAAVGVIEAPIAILARVKVGGAINSLAPSVYFFALAAMLSFRDGLLASGESRYEAGALRAGLLGLQLFCLLLAPRFLYSQVNTIPTGVSSLERVWSFVRKHPGEAYFPQFPLVQLLEENKAYDTAYGIIDREVVGWPATPEEIRAQSPVTAQWLFVIPSLTTYPWIGTDMFHQALPEFSEKTELPELPGFVAYRRVK